MDSRRSLAAVIASLVPIGLASGCSSIGAFDDTVCVATPTGLTTLTPVAGVDFVRLRSQSDISTVEDHGSWGEACKSATDKPKCEAALAAVPFQGGLASTGFDLTTRYELTFTKGDEVGSVQSADALLALIGAVDTPNEAALVAFANGHELPCSEANVRAEGDHFVVLGTKGSTCGGDVEHYEVTVSSDGKITVGESEIAEHGDPNCAIGRRPALLLRRGSAPAPCARRARAGVRATAAGSYFARAAELEAASIVAFEELALELGAHGAPQRLVRGARSSRRDEIRHARVMSAIARRYGAAPRATAIPRQGTRPLLEVVHDNATEGCVRETFGALIATVQARRAQDPVVRAALSRIAVDETRHASLSWAIHAWAVSRLSPTARELVRSAQQRTLEELRREVARDLPEAVQRATGMPDGATQVRLLDGLAEQLGVGAPSGSIDSGAIAGA